MTSITIYIHQQLDLDQVHYIIIKKIELQILVMII